MSRDDHCCWVHEEGRQSKARYSPKFGMARVTVREGNSIVSSHNSPFFTCKF